MQNEKEKIKAIISLIPHLDKHLNFPISMLNELYITFGIEKDEWELRRKFKAIIEKHKDIFDIYYIKPSPLYYFDYMGTPVTAVDEEEYNNDDY